MVVNFKSTVRKSMNWLIIFYFIEKNHFHLLFHVFIIASIDFFSEISYSFYIFKGNELNKYCLAWRKGCR